MNSKELSQRFEKLAERLQRVVSSLEEQLQTEKTASHMVMEHTGSDLGTLSTLPGKSTNPLLDFILS